jgi:hypothetical protein
MMARRAIDRRAEGRDSDKRRGEEEGEELSPCQPCMLSRYGRRQLRSPGGNSPSVDRRDGKQRSAFTIMHKKQRCITRSGQRQGWGGLRKRQLNRK